MATKYDAIIIGTGQAGPPLAVRLAGADDYRVINNRHQIFSPAAAQLLLRAHLLRSS